MSATRILGIIFTSLGGLAEVATMLWAALKDNEITFFEAQRHRAQDTAIFLFVVFIILVAGLVLLFISFRRRKEAPQGQNATSTAKSGNDETKKVPAPPLRKRVPQRFILGAAALLVLISAFFGWNWWSGRWTESRARRAVESLLAQQTTPAKLLDWRSVIDDGPYRKTVRAIILWSSDTLTGEFECARVSDHGWAIIRAEFPGLKYNDIIGAQMFPFDGSRQITESTRR